MDVADLLLANWLCLFVDAGCCLMLLWFGVTIIFGTGNNDNELLRDLFAAQNQPDLLRGKVRGNHCAGFARTQN